MKQMQSSCLLPGESLRKALLILTIQLPSPLWGGAGGGVGCSRRTPPCLRFAQTSLPTRGREKELAPLSRQLSHSRVNILRNGAWLGNGQTISLQTFDMKRMALRISF